jgi:L-threonylcarbamoyladenylate synthase
MNTSISEIITILKQRGVVAAPTDTVYGLLADATNEEAVAKIFTIKGRDERKALPIFVRDIAMAKNIAEMSEEQEQLLSALWPGKVTFVLSKHPSSPLASNVGDTHTIALRIPHHPLIQQILEAFNKPLTGTSANRSGQPSCLSWEAVKKQLANNLPDFIIEGEELPPSLPSTIVDITTKPFRIIRKGAEDKKVEQMVSHLLV